MKRFLAALATLGTLASVATAQTLTMRPLPGGATLIVSQESKNPNIVIEAFFRVGVADENAVGESGMSALLARTWAGGGTGRSGWLLARDIGRFGSLGIWSTGDYIELWTLSNAADREDAAQALLLNIVSTPLFLPVTVENAKRDIERERFQRTDGLLTDALSRLRGRVFVASPAGRDPLGDETSIENAKSVALRRFYLQTVGSDASRAVFVVVGNLDPDEAERLIRSSLAAGDWQPWHNTGKMAKPAPVSSKDAIPEGLKPLELRRAAPNRLALVSYIAPGTTEGAKTNAALQVLDAVLGGGKDCRLFALRDHPGGGKLPIGYDIRSQIDAGREQSLWVAYVLGTAQPSNTTQETLNEVLHTLANGSHPVTDDELLRAKAFLKGKHRRERQRLSERASALGYAQVMGLGATFEAEYDTQIDSVTLVEVNTLAKRIFTANAANAATGTDP